MSRKGGTGIYTQKTIKNKATGRAERVTVQLKPKDVKAFIMKTNKWTEDQYNRERYILKNKLRHYESVTKPKKAESPVALLYKEAKAKQRYGRDYQPSITMKRIKSFTSIGSAKALAKAKTRPSYQKSINEKLAIGTKQAFSGFIAKTAYGKAIIESYGGVVDENGNITDLSNVKDIKLLEDSLAVYADDIKAKIDEYGRRQESAGAIPNGEVLGSGDTLGLNLSDYINPNLG